MKRFRSPFFSCLIALFTLACGSDITDRDDENELVRSAKIDSTFKISVEGGSILSLDRKSNPPVARIRAQSFDMRVETTDSGCEARQIRIEIENLPSEGVISTARHFLNTLTPELQASVSALGGGFTFKPDPHAPSWTPITEEMPSELAHEGDLYVVTLQSDRNRLAALLIPGEADEIVQKPGACARLQQSGQGTAIDQAALVLRQRIRVQPPEGDFAFAFFGNNQGHIGALQTIIDQINEEEDLRFVVIAGDLLGSGKMTAISQVKETLNQLRVPWFVTLGNEDIGKKSDKSLVTNFGQSNFAFDFGTLRLLMLDSAEATFSSVTHKQLGIWLNREPLWWKDEADLRSLIAVTHYAPFDPSGSRSDGFKHRLEAARVVSELERKETDLLLTAHLPFFQTEKQGGLTVVHGGGGGAKMEGGRDHFWVRVDVTADCAPIGQEGSEKGESCGDCAQSLTCKEGICVPCLEVTRKTF